MRKHALLEEYFERIEAASLQQALPSGSPIAWQYEWDTSDMVVSVKTVRPEYQRAVTFTRSLDGISRSLTSAPDTSRTICALSPALLSTFRG